MVPIVLYGFPSNRKMPRAGVWAGINVLVLPTFCKISCTFEAEVFWLFAVEGYANLSYFHVIWVGVVMASAK